MATATFFCDMDFPTATGRIAYLADHTYPNVPEAVVAMMLARGVGEVVPDEVLGLDPDVRVEAITKVTRTRRKKKWGPQ